jgi:hypothetical protein
MVVVDNWTRNVAMRHSRNNVSASAGGSPSQTQNATRHDNVDITDDVYKLGTLEEAVVPVFGAQKDPTYLSNTIVHFNSVAMLGASRVGPCGGGSC